jgi:predicted thioredoxin/glutaredoxin
MNEIKNMKEANQIIKKDFVMVIAKSHTCTICNTILNTLEQNIPNLKDIEIHNIYIDDVDEFRGQHTIFSVPTVLIFSQGKELLRESRYINYAKIQRLIDLYTS